MNPTNIAPPLPPPSQRLPASPVWPTVLGSILICIGCFGVLTNAAGGIISCFMPGMMSGFAQNSGPAQPMMAAQMDVIERYAVWTVLSAVIMSLLGVMLLVAGIGMVRRRQSAVNWIRAWAILRILWAFPASYIGFLITSETFRAMAKAAADSGTAVSGFTAFMQGIGIFTIALAMIMSCALPAFLLIWFALDKVRTDIAHW